MLLLNTGAVKPVYMGEVWLNASDGILHIVSTWILYGTASDPDLAVRIADEVETAWNAPEAIVQIAGRGYRVRFSVRGIHRPELSPDEVHANLNPGNNYFRVEDFCRLHISFVDEIGSNTGYFLRENLTNGSLTAAHEYGHTLGLEHPTVLDIRGQGRPGIMYPRGAWVDAPYQWDPAVPAGTVGGTLNPASRRVLASDIGDLGLERLDFTPSGKAVLGDFTNLYHPRH